MRDSPSALKLSPKRRRIADGDRDDGGLQGRSHGLGVALIEADALAGQKVDLHQLPRPRRRLLRVAHRELACECLLVASLGELAHSNDRLTKFQTLDEAVDVDVLLLSQSGLEGCIQFVHERRQGSSGHAPERAPGHRDIFSFEQRRCGVLRQHRLERPPEGDDGFASHPDVRIGSGHLLARRSRDGFLERRER